MNDVTRLPTREARERAHGPKVDPAPEKPAIPPKQRRRGGAVLGIVALLLLTGALGIGAWRAYSQHRDAIATAQQRRDFIPRVRVATVKPSNPNVTVTLPATT